MEECLGRWKARIRNLTRQVMQSSKNTRLEEYDLEDRAAPEFVEEYLQSYLTILCWLLNRTTRLHTSSPTSLAGALHFG